MEPNADILSRRGFFSRAARFLRGRHVFGLKAEPSRERGKFFSHCCLHSRRVHFNSVANKALRFVEDYLVYVQIILFLPTFFNFPFTPLVLKEKIKPESQPKPSI